MRTPDTAGALAGRPVRGSKAAAFTMAFAAAVLLSVTLLGVVQGVEWAMLSLLGVPPLATAVVLTVTALPLLWLVGLFAWRVWLSERYGPADPAA